MFDVLRSATFDAWLLGLKDRGARVRVQARIRKLTLGNLGDVKRLSKTVSELRIDYGPGYRVYFTTRGPVFLLLLCGGDKRTQTADIKRAEQIVREWNGER